MVCAPSGIEKTKIWSKEILIRKIVRRNPIQTNEISILCLIYVIKSWISIREFRILFDWILDRDTFGYIWISDIYSRKNWNTKEKWKEVKEYSEFHRSKNQCRLWEGEKAFVGDIRKKVEHSSNSKIVERFTTRPSIRSFSFFFYYFRGRSSTAVTTIRRRKLMSRLAKHVINLAASLEKNSRSLASSCSLSPDAKSDIQKCVKSRNQKYHLSKYWGGE